MSGLLAFRSLGSATAYRFDRSTTIHVVASHGGIQEMAWQLKGKVAICDHREYGFAQIHVKKIGNGADVLFEGLGEEFEVGCKVEALESRINSPLDIYRSGCPTGTNSPKSLPTSTSSGIPPLPHSHPSPTTTNRGMASSSTPRSLTPHEGEKSSESSFSTSVTVLHAGQWSVTGHPKGGRTLLMVPGLVARKNSSARKSRASAKSVDLRGE